MHCEHYKLTSFFKRFLFPDDTVFRRIPVEMTEAHMQTFGFQELKKQAILLSLGEDPSRSTSDIIVDLYKVTFVYTDVDGDKAMISSDSDLEEALDQFKKKGSMKVFANVVNYKGEQEAPSRESASESSTQTFHSATDSTTQTLHSSAAAVSSSTATQTARSSATAFSSSSASPRGPKQLQEVVDSFVNAVATAVISVADQIHPPPPFTAAITADTTTPALFIHGRHTCDGCLTTPIVGSRFHATNLPDYDLCSQCKHNYKGSEIQFDVVELDRDRPSQERWQRRQAKLASGRPLRNAAWRHHRAQSNRIRRCGGGGDRGRFAPQYPTQGPPMDLAVAEAIRRSLEDAKKAEEKKQADAVTQTLETAVQKEEKATQSEASDEGETVDETVCEEAGISDEQGADELLVKSNQEVEISDEQESDDETAASMPELAPSRINHQYEMYIRASHANSLVPKVVQVISTDTDSSFASDAEGSGEIAAVLGETLDRVAAAIDEMHLEFDRTPATEQIEKEILVEAVKDKEGAEEGQSSHGSQASQDDLDDCDSWNLVADDDN
jgi:hypothetical protein